MADGQVEIAAVGDTRAGYDPPEIMFKDFREVLGGADLRFAQVESLCTERGSFQQIGFGDNSRLHPRLATAYQTGNIDVVSLASNHTGDWGPEAVVDTVENYQKLGIATIGAGADVAEARKPAFFTRNGLRIGFLAYCSVLLPQYWATEKRAGAAPMRIKTYYEPYEYQPGAPVRIVTIPDRVDLEHLQEDVRRAKQEADFVFVSIHWGVHFVPKPLTDYQPIVGRAAIDAGASAILGHHPHLLQGIELYRGGVIFYGLGNFAFFHSKGEAARRALPNAEFTFDQVYNREIGPGQSYSFRQYWREAGMVFIKLDRSGLKKVSFLPTAMNADYLPEVIPANSPKFDEIRTYLLWVSKGIDGGIEDLRPEGDRLVIFER